MSTKSTIVCGAKFHLYTECFDGEPHVYLEVEDPSAFMVDRDIALTPPGQTPGPPPSTFVTVRLTGDVLKILDKPLLEEAAQRAKAITETDGGP